MTTLLTSQIIFISISPIRLTVAIDQRATNTKQNSEHQKSSAYALIFLVSHDSVRWLTVPSLCKLQQVAVYVGRQMFVTQQVRTKGR